MRCTCAVDGIADIRRYAFLGYVRDMLVTDLVCEPLADKFLRENWDPWNEHLRLPEYAHSMGPNFLSKIYRHKVPSRGQARAYPAHSQGKRTFKCPLYHRQRTFSASPEGPLLANKRHSGILKTAKFST